MMTIEDAHERLVVAAQEYRAAARALEKATEVAAVRKQQLFTALSLVDEIRESGYEAPARGLYVVFTRPPGPDGCEFIDVEDEHGVSVDCVETRKRADGRWAIGPLLPAGEVKR